ncbi:chromosome transmission fidelity protein 1 [Cryptococcus gattii NT-10]|nr:chromosome transmission fidelity protein 1 [Cryptococcus gattii NT-10]
MTNQLAKSATPSLSTPETFPFPYPKPYDIQLDLMRVVFRAIEDGKIAIVESPTGTGKSLSLLTSTLTWLSQHQARLDTAAEASLREQFAADDPDDPPWVIAHAVKARMDELKVVQQEREERLEKARRKEMRMRREGGLGAFKHGPGGGKRIRMGDEEVGKGKTGEIKEDDFLPEDEEKYNDDGPYLSREVYYTSRTHTQLRQLTSELLKTSFANYDPMPESPSAEAPSHGVSLVPLGSRKQLCINEKVRALARKGGDERMNEACLDMQKPAKTDEIMMLDARDMILTSVKDIEDIVAVGKKSCVCPYYATRKAVKQSQIVILPYNLLLQKNAREALGINLKNQVVVIDEAHNLIDTILSIYSTTLTSVNLANALSQLRQYLQRFKSRLKSKHSLWIQQVLSLLQGLIRVCDKFIQDSKSQAKGDKPVGMPKTEVIDANTLMRRIGGGSDQVNPVELVAYLKESKLARKISGFSEHVVEQASLKNAKIPRSATARHASITAFHIVESFLLSLVDAKDDGRILLSIDDLNKSEPVVVIKYILLNPSERFKEVIEDARSVVLAGGTMEPITDFLQQLFPSIPKDRLLTLSCSHVIPKENLLTQVVSVGPRKSEFEFKFGNRNDEALLTDLGAVLQAIIGVVPDGVVVFLPSYAFLDKVRAFWMKSGLLQRLGERKQQLFYEPQTSGDVETILRDYALAITSCHATSAAGQKSRKTGALMFAVVGGKLSEGASCCINFSDNLGRCVIMVGLPFANVGSVELRERMQYVETIPGAGQGASREMYENLCMRAVNQSIGRAIRHANDYATILLVDKRYANPRIRNKLPKWIGEDVRIPQGFGGVARGVATFFKEKKDRGLA